MTGQGKPARRGAGQVSSDLPLRLHHQVYMLLRQQILEGRYPADRPMPGEHDLAAGFAVARVTMRSALRRLEAEGLVTRRRGAGTFARPPGRAEPVHANLHGLAQDLLAMGRRTTVRLVEAAYVAAPAEIAALLKLPAGSVVQKSVRVRSMQDTPFSHLTTWVPEDIGRRFTEGSLATEPLLGLLQQAGIELAHACQTISAKLADMPVAVLLGAEPGEALLWVKRQVFDRDGRVVELIEALYRPDMYAYRIDLLWEGEGWAPRRDMVAAAI